MLRSVPLLAIAGLAIAQAPSPSPIRGFPADAWKQERELELQARALPQAERLRIYMDRMAAQPHHAGSPGSKAVADYALAQLKDWGLDAKIETFEALLPYPTTRFLEMTAPVRFRAQLKEPALPEDPDTANDNQLPPFNAYSASGDVTAPLVYVNYGSQDDYDYLKRQGIDVKGKIVIARYGRTWRGLKPKTAQENGAIGCLIYSDPRDDGFFQNDVYPKGPMRPAQSVQRGSVMDMPLYPGDPLSPGWASEPGARKLSREDAKTIMKIPVLPISYGDAQPLLEQLDGAVVPELWRGALGLTYHTGPGPAMVHLKLDFDWTTKPLYNVIATIPGSVYKDQWIMYGNHHDAWVNGASDPVSGASVLLETARILSVLRARGWQPKRTVMLALWDGEEFGLVGSTEWLEKHTDEMDRKGAVYINSDSTGRGPLGVAGSGSLESFMSEVLRDVNEPGASRSLLDAVKDRPRGPVPPGAPREFHLDALGSGSDYVAFLDHAGIASLNLGFGSSEGVYHSVYDTRQWFDHFSDGDRLYSKTLTDVMTTSILRLSNASVLPLEFNALSSAVGRYVEEIRRELPRRVSRVDLNEISAQLARLAASAKVFDDEASSLLKRAPAHEKLAKANDAIQRTERTLLLADGLPHRDWYKHQIYAPGLSTGYAAKTLPGIRESVESKQWDEAAQQVRRVTQVLRSLTTQVDEATRLLKQAESGE